MTKNKKKKKKLAEKTFAFASILYNWPTKLEINLKVLK